MTALSKIKQAVDRLQDSKHFPKEAEVFSSAVSSVKGIIIGHAAQYGLKDKDRMARLVAAAILTETSGKEGNRAITKPITQQRLFSILESRLGDDEKLVLRTAAEKNASSFYQKLILPLKLAVFLEEAGGQYAKAAKELEKAVQACLQAEEKQLTGPELDTSYQALISAKAALAPAHEKWQACSSYVKNLQEYDPALVTGFDLNKYYQQQPDSKGVQFPGQQKLGDAEAKADRLISRYQTQRNKALLNEGRVSLSEAKPDAEQLEQRRPSNLG